MLSDPKPTQPAWRKSSHSGGSNCVEVAIDGPTVLVRDSKDPDGAVLRFAGDQWRAFVTSVKDGEFEA